MANEPSITDTSIMECSILETQTSIDQTDIHQKNNDEGVVAERQNTQNLPVTPTVQPEPNERNTPPLILSYTPGGSEQWIRRVEVEFTPKIGMPFKKLEEAISFYEIYALACGFNSRLHTTKRFRGGDIRTKAVVCNREGFKDFNRKKNPSETKLKSNQNQPISEKPPKPKEPNKTKITRFGCKAKIVFRSDLKNSCFVVDQFIEEHNHRLSSVKNREFQKLSRNLSLFHKQTIIDHSKLNIGPTKSYRICKEYAKGFQNIGASLTEFKNFQRDIKCFIGNKDAQMFINNFEKLCETNKQFYFAYHVQENNLSRVFWCDSQSRRNYAMFGDNVSYDPTYATNKYCMVFTPFTGVDHHKRSITFACALLENEDEESFKWVFRKFLDAMNNKEPNCIITDQDPAIKNAVPAVFKVARHRFCMWHIMQKLNDKVGKTMCKETELVSRLSSVVWNYDVEPSEFEQNWNQVIEEFDMKKHKWLTKMYDIRSSWIPAYYRDLSLANILRTTQRSESENNFFKRFENQYGTLVEFWMRFQSAIEQQRHSQRSLDEMSDSTLPVALTPLDIERHALTVYTHKVFYEFQVEVVSSIRACGVGGLTKNDDVEVTDVDDAEKSKTFTVVYYVRSQETTCTCKLFEQKGILCRHIVLVYSGKQVKKIPEQYIVQRWTRNAHKNPIYDLEGNVMLDYDSTDLRKMHLSKVWTEFYSTIGIVATKDETCIKELAEIIKKFREKISSPNETTLTKEQEIEMLLGCKGVSEVNILPPNHAKNKGSGKRLISNKAKSIAKAEKPKRLCRNCKQMATHDKRNCPNPFVEVNEPEDDAADEQENVGSISN